MLLAIDTATRWAGLALHDGRALVAELGWQCLNTHTIELTPTLYEMFGRAGIDAADLTAISVAIGPGSYTGLRVGLALAKGLALANKVPLVGVHTLDILAASFGPLDGRLLLAAAAGRQRVCAALFQWQGEQWLADSDPVIDSWEQLLTDLNDEPTVFAGEITTASAKRIQAASKHYKLAAPAASLRRAGYLAELGWRQLRQGSADDAGSLAPLYLRDPAGK